MGHAGPSIRSSLSFLTLGTEAGLGVGLVLRGHILCESQGTDWWEESGCSEGPQVKISRTSSLGDPGLGRDHEHVQMPRRKPGTHREAGVAPGQCVTHLRAPSQMLTEGGYGTVSRYLRDTWDCRRREEKV